MINSIPKKLRTRLIEKYPIDNNSLSILNTYKSSDLTIAKSSLNTFINLNKVNSIRHINQFYEKVNNILIDDGYYISCVSTLENRANKIKSSVPSGISHLFIFFDFILNRVLPKLPITKNIYFLISRGKNRVISSTEILGRLVSCGFKVIEHFEYENLLYVVSQKRGKPLNDKNASYGPLFKMKRIGYQGKMIYLYKIRTMYPYSEFLQKELYDSDKLSEDGDKIKNDFRVTYWGKIFRKFWIDEFPQIYNLLKGDISLVGVRAVSTAKFELFDQELQNLRVKIKPGLVPPYYSDLPKNFKEFQESEKRYIIQKMKKPLSTDIKYFFHAFFNILFRGARSK